MIAGLLFHVLAAALGLSALFMAIPLAYEALKWAGAAYLLYLAWQVIKHGARSAFEVRELSPDPPRKLFLMGLLTAVLNPKIAVFYLAIFPQFVSPEQGAVLLQSLQLGITQIGVSFSVNLAIVLCASGLARWLARSPKWAVLQRYVMGAMLAYLAVRLALEPRRA